MHSSQGAIAIRSILTAVMAFTAVALVGGALVSGDLGAMIQEGADLISDQTDFTLDINEGEQGERKMSDMMKFVYHRASNDGCREGQIPSVPEQNKGNIDDTEGYPGLSDTYIGEEPRCLGASGKNALRASNEKNPLALIQERGYDMEGFYSRVNFEVDGEEPVTIDMNSGDSYRDRKLLAVSKQSLDRSIMQTCDRSRLIELVPYLGTFSEARHIGTGDRFVMYFNNESAAEERANLFVQDRLDHRVYCAPFEFNIGDWKLQESPVGNQFKSVSQEVKLCPGDKGYVQMNKHFPNEDGEVGEEITGSTYKFPHIVITETETRSC